MKRHVWYSWNHGVEIVLLHVLLTCKSLHFILWRYLLSWNNWNTQNVSIISFAHLFIYNCAYDSVGTYNFGPFPILIHIRNPWRRFMLWPSAARWPIVTGGGGVIFCSATAGITLEPNAHFHPYASTFSDNHSAKMSNQFNNLLVSVTQFRIVLVFLL